MCNVFLAVVVFFTGVVLSGVRGSPFNKGGLVCSGESMSSLPSLDFSSIITSKDFGIDDFLGVIDPFLSIRVGITAYFSNSSASSASIIIV